MSDGNVTASISADPEVGEVAASDAASPEAEPTEELADSDSVGPEAGEATESSHEQTSHMSSAPPASGKCVSQSVSEESKDIVEVTIRYGPYEACGIVEHRLHRLQGIQHVLEKAGYKIHLEPVSEWNIVELIVREQLVFNCDIRDLDFGGDGLLDGLCVEAMEQVKTAY